MNTNIYNLFSKISSDNIAIIYENTEYSFKDVKNHVENLSKSLLNFKCNEKSIIGLLLEETPELVFSLLSISRSNAKFFMINPKYPVSLIETLISKLNPQLIISTKSLIYKLGKFVSSIKTSLKLSNDIY
ncbi:MAG: AMP-binding protein [Endomicrobia bacterium]|nr:AMP-binding protein [Endomicrobiia bacterium]